MKNLLYNVRTQVFVVVLGIAAIIVSLHFLFLQPLIHNTLIKHELEQVHSAAYATAQTLDLEIGLAVKSLESVAALDGFKELDRERIDRSLSIYDATNPFYIYTWVMDSNGKVISVPALPDRLGEDRSTRDYFVKTTSETPTHFQKVQISTRGNFSLVVGTAIRNDQGGKIGVLAGSLGLMDRNSQMYQAVTNAPFSEEYKVFLFSSDNIMLAHSDKKLPQASREGFDLLSNQPISKYLDTENNETKAVSFQGKKYILSIDSVPSTDWKVVVQVPESIVHKSVDKIITNLTILLGLLLLIVLFVSFSFANSFSRSLKRLTNALNTFGEQGKSEEIEVTGGGEINDAIKAFNQMVRGRQKTELELQKSELRFRSLISQASDAFFLHDLEGQILDVNQRACESLGYSKEELLSMTVADLDAVSVSKNHRENIWSKIQPDAPITVENIHRRKDGTSFPVEVRIGTFTINDEKNILSLARDISDRKKTEENLQQAQKMEAIGTLAGGIAHDFNNILTPIIGYAELALQTLQPNDSVADSIREIQKAGNRARHLVQQILTFSRKDEQTKHKLSPHIIIKESIKLLRSSLPTTIEIRENIPSNCGSVLGDPTQLQQVIINLCTNAYHAMRTKGGVLAVSLKGVHIPENDEKILAQKMSVGHYVEIEVSDTGIGIDKKTAEKIFEPYFTTKIKGEGTGLGLATVHGIVKSYDGYITVDSEPGQGTTFHVYLPREDTPEQIDTIDIKKEPLPVGTERVLLVDDEKSITNMLQSVLAALGYDVTTSNNSEDALKIFSENPDRYDLVFTDMTMPHMTGIELSLRIFKISPDTPIILCTGFSEHIDKENALKLGIREFLMKPVSVHDLAHSVRKVLEQR